MQELEGILANSTSRNSKLFSFQINLFLCRYRIYVADLRMPDDADVSWVRRVSLSITVFGVCLYMPIKMHIISGDVARVNGQLAVSRAFGDKNLKSHLRSDPDVTTIDIDGDTDLLILASDGLWKVPSA